MPTSTSSSAPARLITGLLPLLLLTAGLARADETAEAPSLNLLYSLAAVSDSRERGLSNSANRPAISAGLELLHASGAFAKLELLSVSRDQYPAGHGRRVQLSGGYRWGDPDGWQFELGGLHSHFPAARQPGLEGYRLIFNRRGEVIDLRPLPASVRPNTTELFGSLAYQGWALRYFHTVSRNFYAIESRTVCAVIEDLEASYDCFEQGLKGSRGSAYLELAYTYRLSKTASLELRLGQQHVRRFRDFDSRSFGLEYRHNWQGYQLSAGLVGARAREREAYQVEVDGKSRDTSRTALVLGIGRNF